MSLDQFIQLLAAVTLFEMMAAIGLGVTFAEVLGDFGPSRPRCRTAAVHVQGRRRGLHGFFERTTRSLESRHFRGCNLGGLWNGSVFLGRFSGNRLPYRSFWGGGRSTRPAFLNGASGLAARRRAFRDASRPFGGFPRLLRLLTLPFRHRFYPFGTLTVWR